MTALPNAPSRSRAAPRCARPMAVLASARSASGRPRSRSHPAPADRPAPGGNSNGADRSRREPTQARPQAARSEAERAERGRPREEASGRSDGGATTRERGSKDATRLSSSRKSLISGDSEAQPASGRGRSEAPSSPPKCATPPQLNTTAHRLVARAERDLNRVETFLLARFARCAGCVSPGSNPSGRSAVAHVRSRQLHGPRGI